MDNTNPKSVADSMMKTVIRKTRTEILAAIIHEESAWQASIAQLTNCNNMPEFDHALDEDIAALKLMLGMLHITSEHFKNIISTDEV